MGWWLNTSYGCLKNYFCFLCELNTFCRNELLSLTLFVFSILILLVLTIFLFTLLKNASATRIERNLEFPWVSHGHQLWNASLSVLRRLRDVPMTSFLSFNLTVFKYCWDLCRTFSAPSDYYPNENRTDSKIPSGKSIFFKLILFDSASGFAEPVKNNVRNDFWGLWFVKVKFESVSVKDTKMFHEVAAAFFSKLARGLSWAQQVQASLPCTGAARPELLSLPSDQRRNQPARPHGATAWHAAMERLSDIWGHALHVAVI